MSTFTSFHPRLTECKQCKQFKFVSKKHPIYTGCYIIQCSLCYLHWYVCVEHNKRFNHLNKPKLHDHFVNDHSYLDSSLHKLQYDESIHNCIVDTFSDDSDNDVNYSHIDKKPKHTSSFEQSTNNPKTNKNNADNILSDNTLKNIISKAFSNSEYNTLNVNEDEVDFHLNMTHFCSDLSEAKQYQLVEIIQQLLSLKFKSTRPPTIYQDIRRFYLSGKHSIYRNIPRPSVKDIDNHACVSLKDIITFSLNTLNDLSLILCSKYNELTFDNSSMIYSLKAKRILHRIHQQYSESTIDPYIMFVTFWSDDFEVNHTRKNRSSTWIKTMTLVTLSKTNTSKHYTHLVAIGHKGCSHTKVNAHIHTELLLLQKVNYYYMNTKQALIPVIIYPLVVLTDRPERCSLNSTLSFAGIATRRWLFSSMTSPDKIASCQTCYNRRLKNYFKSRTNVTSNSVKKCGRCCDFEYCSKSKASYFKPPPHYPCSKHNDSPPFPKERDTLNNLSNDKLIPTRLTYSYLYEGVKAASFNLFTKTWKIAETRSYLKVLGVSTSLSEKVIEYSINANQQNIDYVSFYNSLPLPTTWTDGLLDIDQFIETPMHHIFEGIIKTLIEVTMDYLKFHKLWSKYCESINPTLDDIEGLKCDFCRVESFWHSKTDYKPSGWIAETYLGYARIIVVLLVHIESLIKENLKASTEFKCMIQTSFVLVSHLMSRTSTSTTDLKEIIKIFLSACHKFDQEFGYSDNNIPFWFKKSNFVSLLNLPQQIDEYGPLYLCWEGSKERYIQYVKPMLKNKRKTVTFLLTKVDKLLQDNALDLLKSRFLKKTSKEYSRYNDIFIFASKNDIKEKIDSGEPFSVLIRRTNIIEIFAILKDNDKYYCYDLLFDDNNGFHKFHLWFAPLILRNSTNGTIINKDDIKKYREDIGLLISIPQMNTADNTTNNCLYTLLVSDWTIRSQEGMLHLPTLSRELFGIK